MTEPQTLEQAIDEALREAAELLDDRIDVHQQWVRFLEDGKQARGDDVGDADFHCRCVDEYQSLAEKLKRLPKLIRLFGKRCARETANRMAGKHIGYGSRPSMKAVIEAALASPLEHSDE